MATTYHVGDYGLDPITGKPLIDCAIGTALDIYESIPFASRRVILYCHKTVVLMDLEFLACIDDEEKTYTRAYQEAMKLRLLAEYPPIKHGLYRWFRG